MPPRRKRVPVRAVACAQAIIIDRSAAMGASAPTGSVSIRTPRQATQTLCPSPVSDPCFLSHRPGIYYRNCRALGKQSRCWPWVRDNPTARRPALRTKAQRVGAACEVSLLLSSTTGSITIIPGCNPL